MVATIPETRSIKTATITYTEAADGAVTNNNTSRDNTKLAYDILAILIVKTRSDNGS